MTSETQAAINAFNVLSPAEREAVLAQQPESFGRGMIQQPGDRQAAKLNWIDRGAWVASKLIPVIMAEFPDAVPERDERGMSAHHLLFMAQTLSRRELNSETKVCRWLGWLQAGVSVVCSGEGSSLEDMKELNLASGEITPRMSGTGFQARCQAWLDEVTKGDATNLDERLARFLEEALELVQSLHMTEDQARQLVEYVFSRPIGDPAQEFGGMQTTAMVLGEYVKLDVMACAERELARVWDPAVIEKIRGKRSRRHGRGPLPGTTEEADPLPAGCWSEDDRDLDGPGV